MLCGQNPALATEYRDVFASAPSRLSRASRRAPQMAGLHGDIRPPRRPPKAEKVKALHTFYFNSSEHKILHQFHPKKLITNLKYCSCLFTSGLTIS